MCNIDQEAEIFKLRGTQYDFLTLDCTGQWIEAAILEVRTTTNLDELHELSESHSEHKSIEGMRTSCSPNINEVSGQVKYRNKQYRSDLTRIFVLICVNSTDR